jgi:prepilin-type N-terminal cleavage/methylation domain-containing protein
VSLLITARLDARRGFTMLEITVSIMILTVAAYILSSTIGASLSHTVSKREQATAVEAAMSALESMRATEFLDLFVSYNTSQEDDPLGPGTAPGPTFAVPGLDPIIDAMGVARPVGRIFLPEVDGQLREDVPLPVLGMPRDLNGDIVVDAVDHGDDYLVLPAVVRIEWRGRLGPRHFELSTMFCDLRRESEDP